MGWGWGWRTNKAVSRMKGREAGGSEANGDSGCWGRKVFLRSPNEATVPFHRDLNLSGSQQTEMRLGCSETQRTEGVKASGLEQAWNLIPGIGKPSVKGRRVNIFGFAGSTISVATTPLCLCSSKATTGHMQMRGWAAFQYKLCL